MKLSELLKNSDFVCLNPEVGTEGEIKTGYACDLLSWVMANADISCAWVTIQTHVNIIAVAALLEMTCVIIPEDAGVDRSTIERGTLEKVPIISTGLTAYEVCKFLGKSGI